MLFARIVSFLALTGLTGAQEPSIRIGMPIPMKDGVHAAVPCEDGTVRLFALATGESEAVLSGHEGMVRAVRLAPGGKTLASYGQDRTIRLWDLEDYSCRAMLETPGVWPHSNETTAFSPNGEHLVALCRDRFAKVWNAKTGQEEFVLPSAARTTSATWVTGDRLCTVGLDKCIRVWDVKRGVEVREPIEHDERLSCVSVSPEGNHVATGDYTNHVHLWSLETGERLAEADVTEGPSESLGVDQLLFSKDGEDLLVAVGFLWRCYALDAETLECRWSFHYGGGRMAPFSIAIDEAERFVALSALGQVVRRSDGARVKICDDLGTVRWSPGDRYLVSSPRNETCVFDGKTFELLYRRTELPDGKSSITK